MYWSSMVTALQHYAPVTLRYPNGRWHAVWEAIVRIGDDPPEHWLSGEGQTPAAAVTALWDRVTSQGRTLTIFGEETIKTRWNGQWHEEVLPPTTASPKTIDPDDCPF